MDYDGDFEFQKDSQISGVTEKSIVSHFSKTRDQGGGRGVEIDRFLDAPLSVFQLFFSFPRKREFFDTDEKRKSLYIARNENHTTLTSLSSSCVMFIIPWYRQTNIFRSFSSPLSGAYITIFRWRTAAENDGPWMKTKTIRTNRATFNTCV